MSGKLMTFNLAVSTNCLIQTMHGKCGIKWYNDSINQISHQCVIKTKLELLLLVYLHRLWENSLQTVWLYYRQWCYFSCSLNTCIFFCHDIEFFVYKCCETTNRYSSDLIYTFRFIPWTCWNISYMSARSEAKTSIKFLERH